nr:hypothetical protein [Jiangella ureilytica]
MRPTAHGCRRSAARAEAARPRIAAAQGLPVWRRHVGDPVLASNLTRRVDFALFMIEALTDDSLIHEAPAIVGRLTPSVQGATAT